MTVSIVGQAIGFIIVAAVMMMVFGLDLVAAGLVGLTGVLVGGWIAESYFSDETIETRAAGG